jgi:hypothetical protein
MRIITILLLVLLTVTGYAQKRQNIDQLVVKDSLTIKAGNPAANKIAVSVDGNGRFRWVYFSDFQDSINTGVFDTSDINVLIANTVKVNRDSFTDPAATIASIGDSGFIVQCAATCEDIRWTTIDGTQTVLKDSSNSVGIGTSAPIKPLHVEGEVYFHKRIGDVDYYLVVDENNEEISLYALDTLTGISTNVTVNASQAQIAYNGNGSRHSVLCDNISGINLSSTGANPNLKIDIPSSSIGYVLTSDASGNATWQDHTGYGEMGFGDSTRTIALTQNVFSVVTNSNNTLWQTAAIDLHNVTYSGDSLIIDSAGTYQVNVQLSMDGTSGSVIRLGVFLNGVLACSCTGYQELLNNRILQLTYINIDALNAGDVLQVVITNTANNDDVDAIGGKLIVNKIR